VPERGRVYFSGLSPAIRDSFMSYFGETFELSLIPHQSTGGPRFNRDFLTWLWTKADERDGTIRTARGNDIRLTFVKRLLLESGEGDYAESILCQGRHADFSEVVEALRAGKKIKEARLSLQEDENLWEFTFKADELLLQGLKLPATPPDEGGEDLNPLDRSASLLERLYLLDQLWGHMDDLITLFAEESPT